MNYLLIFLFSVLFINPCNKNEQSSNQPQKESVSGKNNNEDKTGIKDKDAVFLGRFTDGRLLIEDNRTFEKNSVTWAKDTMENYDKYSDYLKSIAKKYASYKDDVPAYYFDSYKDEFKKLTTLNEGDKLYISQKEACTRVKSRGFILTSMI